MPRNDSRENNLTPQARTALKRLRNTGSLTNREALIDHSIQHLPKRIQELRDAGFDITSVWKTHPVTGQRYTRYYLAMAEEAVA